MDNCITKIDSSFLRERLTEANTSNDEQVKVLIKDYERSLLRSLDSIQVDFNKADLFEIKIPVLQRKWRFFINKEKISDTLFTARVYLIAKDHATINDIFYLAYASNYKELDYKVSTCILDSSIIITQVTKQTSDLIIDEHPSHIIDSSLFLYKIHNDSIFLSEEQKYRKYN